MMTRLILLCPLIAVGMGQVSQPPPPPPPPPLQTSAGPTAQFKASSNLVIVDAVVTDKSGKPIKGLKQGDFTVLEDGKPQKVSVFEYQELSSETEPPAKLTLSDELKLPEAPKTSISPEQPGELQYHDKRLMIFFLDFSSMGMNEQLRAQEASLDYVKKFITKDDMVAIMLYTSAFQVLSDCMALKQKTRTAKANIPKTPNIAACA